MASRPIRSISGPIALGAVSVVLAAGLLVGWIYVILRNLELTRQYAQNTWLLVTGIVSFGVIILVLVIFSVFLVREIREVRRQTSFIDSVTHELRSPLAALRLCLETLKRRELDPARRVELQEMMLDDVERLSSFVDDILEANRAVQSGRTHAVAEVHIASLVHRVVQGVCKRHRIDPSRVRVEVPEHLFAHLDGVSLEVALRNIVDNAVKYSDGEPSVTVQIGMADGHLVARVQDEGIGIPRRDLKRVRRRFYRVPEEPVRARRGTGLGLFVVSSLVHAMGGKLVVESEGRGKGTTVTLRVPARSAVAQDHVHPERA